MRNRLCSGWLAAVVLVPALAHAAVSTRPADYKREAGPHAVAVKDIDWQDAARDRRVPAKIYYPQDEDGAKGPLPVVIFSHGLGGSRDGYAYLGRHWASYGYVAVHLQHEGSDAAVWRGKQNAAEEMRRAARDPQNSINRPRDVSFAIDQLAKMQVDETSPLHGRLDLNRIAVAGHSFGAFTALKVVGEGNAWSAEVGGRSDPAGGRPADKRVKAAIAMSAPVPGRRGRDEEVFSPIAVPILHMTGTLDESPIAETQARERRIPYDHIHKADQYLVTFNGGDHMIFTGHPRPGPRGQKDTEFHDLIRMATIAFLDAYLHQDPNAKTWLQTGGLKAAMGKQAVVEHKDGHDRASATTRPQLDTPAEKTGRRPIRR